MNISCILIVLISLSRLAATQSNFTDDRTVELNNAAQSRQNLGNTIFQSILNIISKPFQPKNISINVSTVGKRAIDQRDHTSLNKMNLAKTDSLEIFINDHFFIPPFLETDSGRTTGRPKFV